MHDPRGEVRFYLLTVFPQFDRNGSALGLFGTALEVGELFPREPVAAQGMLSAEEQAHLLASFSRSFAETGNDYPAVLDTVARLVGEAVGDAAVIQLVNEDGTLLSPPAFYHSDPAARPVFSTAFNQITIADFEYFAGEIYREGKPMAAADLAQRPDLQASLPPALREAVRQHPIHAVLFLPLHTPRGMQGILSAWRSRTAQPYTPKDLALWQDVADRAALTIENARLYAEEVQRNRQLSALHDATMALLSTLDQEVLLGRILDAVQKAIPAADHGVLYLVAPRTGQLEVRATSGFRDPRIQRTGPLRNMYANRAMRERTPLLIRDAGQSAGPRETHDGAAQITPAETPRSIIIAPLLLGDEVLGTLMLSAARPNVFSLSDLQILVSFAATTTAALRNAMLHGELQQIAITDALTGLYNRRGLLELGKHEIDRFQRFGQPFSAIMLDIDNFKQVNDKHGHPIGDQVLCGLAELCKSLIRQLDILARYGGEEFAILLPETDLFQASSVAERLRRAVEEKTFSTEQGPISITISLGVSRAGRSISSVTDLIEQADAALYQAKQKGRNRVELA